jgi:hypothetical protein
MLTAERLREVLHYDPDTTGQFTWIAKPSPCCSIRVGDVAGGADAQGYIRIRVDKARYRAHRLAWLWMTGEWPAAEIDHLNGMKSDNRWVNLREATHAQNQQNTGKQRNNTSGYRGVSWSKRAGKWHAQIMKDGKNIHIGLYPSPAVAHIAYMATAVLVHGKYARFD